MEKKFADFIKAIENQNDSFVLELYKPEYLNMITKDNSSPLHVALLNNKYEPLQKFMQSCDCKVLNKQMENGDTLLHLAVKKGLIDIVKQLVNLGADASITNKENITPQALSEKFKLSAITNQLKQVKEYDTILEYAADDNLELFQPKYEQLKPRVDIRDRKRGGSAMIEILINNKCVTILKYLLDLKLSKEESESYENLHKDPPYTRITILTGTLFLCRAFGEFRQGIDDILIFERICRPDFLVCEALTDLGFPHVLQKAVNYASKIILGALMPYIPNEEYWVSKLTFLESQVCQEAKRIVQLRIKSLLDKYAEGYNRLHIAVIDNNLEVVEYLLRNKMYDINSGFETVGPPVFLAIKHKAFRVVDELVKYKPNINYVDYSGQSLFQWALENKMSSYFQLLLNECHVRNRGRNS